MAIIIKKRKAGIGWQRVMVFVQRLRGGVVQHHQKMIISNSPPCLTQRLHGADSW
jgi:hypothetical protein